MQSSYYFITRIFRVQAVQKVGGEIVRILDV